MPRGQSCVAAGVAALLLLMSACGGDKEAEPELEGVEIVRVGEANHVREQVEYDRNPPAGGSHNPVPAKCGFYDEEVFPELAVHTLEHGVVWIAYDPDLDAADTDALHELVREHERLLVSPVADMDAPVVATAWARQLELDALDVPRLELFIARYTDADSAPEGGRACTGGFGDPIP